MRLYLIKMMATTKFTPKPQTPVKAAGFDVDGGLGKDLAALNHNPAKTMHNSDNTAITSSQQYLGQQNERISFLLSP